MEGLSEIASRLMKKSVSISVHQWLTSQALKGDGVLR